MIERPPVPRTMTVDVVFCIFSQRWCRTTCKNQRNDPQARKVIIIVASLPLSFGRQVFRASVPLHATMNTKDTKANVTSGK